MLVCVYPDIMNDNNFATQLFFTAFALEHIQKPSK